MRAREATLQQQENDRNRVFCPISGNESPAFVADKGRKNGHGPDAGWPKRRLQNDRSPGVPAGPLSQGTMKVKGTPIIQVL